MDLCPLKVPLLPGVEVIPLRSGGVAILLIFGNSVEPLLPGDEVNHRPVGSVG